MRRRICCLLPLLLLLLFTGCRQGQEFEGGRLMSPEELAALQESLQQETVETVPGAEHTPENGIVFWLAGGTVYHTDNSCYHIRNKENICSGSVTVAAGAGKTKACTACAPQP